MSLPPAKSTARISTVQSLSCPTAKVGGFRVKAFSFLPARRFVRHDSKVLFNQKKFWSETSSQFWYLYKSPTFNSDFLFSRRLPFIQSELYFFNFRPIPILCLQEFSLSNFFIFEIKLFGSSDSKKVIFKGVFNQKKKFLREGVSIRNDSNGKA